MSHPQDQALHTAARICAAMAAHRSPGRPLLVAIDGMTGSGKSTLACAVEGAWRARNPEFPPDAVPHLACISLDELVHGWGGLETAVHGLGEQLAAAGGRLMQEADAPVGAPAQGSAQQAGDPDAMTPLTLRLEPWDWEAMAPAPEKLLSLDAQGVLLLEGCGALAAVARPLPGWEVLRVWLEVPTAERHARIAARDAYTWDVAAWEASERHLHGAWRGKAAYEPEVTVGIAEGST